MMTNFERAWCWRDLLLPVALLMLSPGLAAAATAVPSVPATDTHHGVPVADPFRNLEDLKHPDTRQWLLAQGEQAAAQLVKCGGGGFIR